MQYPRHLHKKGWEWRALLKSKKTTAGELSLIHI